MAGIACTAAGLLMPSAASAAPVTCSITATGVSFGAYDPRSATATDGVGSVTVTCDKSNTPSMILSSSTGQSGSYATRRMSSGAYTLNYNLYTTATRTIVWGDGSAGTSAPTLSATGTYTIYGRIPPLQNVGAGTYSDSVSVTITY
jgi:spore coat protein U-like protein